MVRRPGGTRARHNARQFPRVNAFTYAYKAAVFRANDRVRAQAALRLAERKYLCETTAKDDEDGDDRDSRVHTCFHRNVVGATSIYVAAVELELTTLAGSPLASGIPCYGNT